MALRPSGFIAVPPGRAPGFDHADVYRAGGRVYVAHTGADRVDVIDARGRRYLRALPDLPGVAGVLIDQEHDLLFTSDRDCARVSVFRCSDERLLGRVAVGPRPNGLAYDPGRRRLVVFNIGEPGVVQVVDAGRFRTEEVVRTEAGAHTTAWDADRRALYVFCPASRGAAVYAER
ncbi:MAG TPA: hypothetical protein VG370_06920 [Chloroflexota bacterium]|nr:hypothetical protein [Chloroflexota bacterium]